MLREEYEKLEAAADKGNCISIAISETDTPIHGVFIPWESTTSAYNMRMPKITLNADDLQNESIMQLLKKCELIGCYIFTALDDYSFIKDFINLMDLFILHGENVKDLSFTRNLPNLFMFYLEEAVLQDIEPLISNFSDNRPFGICIGFYKCSVKDTSVLSDVKFYSSEFLVWGIEGDDMERWKPATKPGIFRFYPCKQDV